MIKYLNRIDSPADLKKLTPGEIPELAREIRQFLIETVSRTGGHLAPNLGVVEVTLALHSVFDSPQDNFVWDVGHQCYVHKLITNRRRLMPSLRQFKGMAGFPKREESPHDCFNTGHSSTSISAALGLALARDMKGEKNHVLAVIGDGALTGGMSFEALNHAGHIRTNLIVILNDNEMSIAPNVGALSGYLSRMRTDPRYSRSKEEIEDVVRRLPIGHAVLKAMERVKDSFKYLLVPGMFFEELGFTYLGPIDGHNYSAVRQVLQNAKTLTGPVLVHVITQKGKGYVPAEAHPEKFHGVGRFEIHNGKPLPVECDAPSYTKVFGQTIVELARSNPWIVGITAAMPEGTGLTEFAANFPRRFFDVGIAEQHAVTMAAGIATQGFRPVVAIYSTFLQRAYDQILHDVALQKLPVTLAIDRAGLVGEDGETHQGLFDFSYLRPIPNMVVMAPKDENELRRMLLTATTGEGPAAVRYPRGSGIGVALDPVPEPLAVGKAEVLKNGEELVILAIGNMVYPALQAAEILAAEGVEAGVVNCRFVKPLDRELITYLAGKAKCLVTVEEHVLSGGFGSAVLELLNEEQFNLSPLIRIGIPDVFVEHGAVDTLRELYGLTPAGIAQRIREVLSGLRQRRRGEFRSRAGAGGGA